MRPNLKMPVDKLKKAKTIASTLPTFGTFISLLKTNKNTSENKKKFSNNTPPVEFLKEYIAGLTIYGKKLAT